MISYTVSYKRPGDIFWHKIKNVVEDGIQEDRLFRVLITEDGQRIELPFGILIRFSKERGLVIANHLAEVEAQKKETEEAKAKPKLVIPGRK